MIVENRDMQDVGRPLKESILALCQNGIGIIILQLRHVLSSSNLKWLHQPAHLHYSSMEVRQSVMAMMLSTNHNWFHQCDLSLLQLRHVLSSSNLKWLHQPGHLHSSSMEVLQSVGAVVLSTNLNWFHQCDLSRL